MEYLPGGEIERPSQIVFCLLPWRHDFLLASLGHPCRPDLGQEVNIAFISKDHHFMRLQRLSMPPNPSQALDPLWVVILSHQLGPFPHPAHFMEPPSYGPCGNLHAVFPLELGSQRGTTPPRPTPAIGTGCGLEECPQRALHPGHQDCCPDGGLELALCV